MKKINREDVENIVEWFAVNKRDLPWRANNNPYAVWISEIMLQQTRIEAVIPKYLAFMHELPNIESLAGCDDDKLMKLWEGLGYYSRARNIKKCALVLKDKYYYKFPQTKKELITLPGIGPYTAGAIASICFGEKVSAVDGNVLRVLARYFGYKEDIRDSETANLFSSIIENSFSSNDDALFIRYFTQGLMELGEVICIPKGTPNCSSCPLSKHCKAYISDEISSIPYRSKLKERKIVNKTVLIVHSKDRFLVHKRNDTGLLANLFEFVNIDDASKEDVINLVESLGFHILNTKESITSKHIFTHIEWHMRAYEIEVSELHQPLLESYYFLTHDELQKVSIPSAFQAYLKHYHLR